MSTTFQEYKNRVHFKGSTKREYVNTKVRESIDSLIEDSQYGFSIEVILEACNRTIANTHKADFKYTDSILKNWAVNQVHNLSDVSRMDLVFQQGKASKKKVAKPTANSQFNNFESRSYDMNSLEAQLLNSN